MEVKWHIIVHTNTKDNGNKGSERKPFVKREFEPRPQGLTVVVRNNDVQKAMRKLKRMIKDDGLLDDIKNKSHYRKPSEIKREKRKATSSRKTYGRTWW